MGGQWGDALAGGGVCSPGPFLSLVVGVGRSVCAVFLAFVLTWGFVFRVRCVGPMLGCRARVRGARRGCCPWGRQHTLVHLPQVVSAQVSWQEGALLTRVPPLSRWGRWAVRLCCVRSVGGPGGAHWPG